MTVYVKKLDKKNKISWKGAETIEVTEYSISEEGFREKTSSFISPTYIDLSTGVYQVLIVSPYHENYSGVILSVDYKAKDNLYSYKSKDFHVLYNEKATKVYKKTTGRDVLVDALTWDKIGKHTKKNLKKYKRQLNGLLKNAKYDMKKYGLKKNLNPMTKKYKNQKIENKTYWEIIKAYTIGTGAYLNLKVNDYGTILIRPFDVRKFVKPKYKITDVNNDLSLKIDTSFFIENSGAGNIYNVVLPEKQDTTSLSNDTTEKSDNPYNTKEKKIVLNMDTYSTPSKDKKYLNDVAKHLRKLGWKVEVLGVGPSYFSRWDLYKKAKNGIYLTINNGQDTQNIREVTHANYCAGKCRSSWNVLPAIFWMDISKGKSILKGGKYYNNLCIAHDANSSAGASMPYPASHMAKSGVPFGFVANANAKQMAEKINSGGDSKKALQTDFFKVKTRGYNANVGDKNGY